MAGALAPLEPLTCIVWRADLGLVVSPVCDTSVRVVERVQQQAGCAPGDSSG